MRGDPLSVLLVEDEPVDVMAVERVLRTRSIRANLTVARSAEEGIASLVRAADPTARSVDEALPDLVLTDLRLPALSGLDLLDRVRKQPQLRHIPVVILSTSCQDRDVARAYALGAAGYLVKTLEFSEFADALSVTLGYWGTVARPAT